MKVLQDYGLIRGQMSADELPFMDGDDKPCLICGDRSDGTHFGAESCRACAAFFRRTIVSEKHYYCQADDNCIVDKNARCMCRSCRFRKCFAVGMQRDLVQGRRDPIIPRVKHGSGENGTPTPSTSKNGNHCKMEVDEPFLLQKIMRNYKKMCEEKKSIELMMDPSITVRAKREGPLKGFTMGRSSQLSAFNKSHTPALWEFAVSTFEEFESLSKEEQFTLFPSFIALLWGMDHCYHTYKQVPKDMYSYISIVSETTYFDFNQCEAWLSGLSPQAETLRTDIIKTIKSSRTKAKLKQLYLMEEMKLEEEEYAALLGLILWNQNFESISEEMDAVVKKMRARVFKQLEIFYLSKGMKSYAERLGELMGLHGTILVDAIRFREDMEVFNLLQAVEKDDVFFESMRNSQCF